MSNLAGYSWGNTVTTLGDPGGVVTWSIAPGGLDTGVFPSGPGTSVDPSSFLTIPYEELIGAAFAEWSSHGDIEFMQIEDGGGAAGVGTEADIRIFFGPVPGNTLGWAYFPTGPGNPAAGDIILDNQTSFNSDPEKFYTLVLHEIGHTLGLDHENSGVATVMTSSLSAGQLQPFDIQAIQDIYGPQTSAPPVFNFDPNRKDLTILQGPQNLIINANDKDNRILGSESAETMNGGFGFDTLLGGGGNDTLNGGDLADSLRGGDGDDLLIGGDGFDNLFGDAGNDTLNAGDSADRAYGGAGDDVIYGGSNFGLSVDGLFGEAGNDTIYGEAGFDLLDGGDGDDVLDGGANADNLLGGAGNDTLRGGEGLDRLFGGDGNDFGRGGTGDDGLFGEAGDDTLFGEDGNDRFFGGMGDDQLDGGAGSDTLYGGAGFDTLTGGAGNDLLQGNFNADTFVFADGHGSDTIVDFDAQSSLEKINLKGVTAITDMTDLIRNHADQDGRNVVIDTGGGNSITLQNVSMSELDSSDFIF